MPDLVTHTSIVLSNSSIPISTAAGAPDLARVSRPVSGITSSVVVAPTAGFQVVGISGAPGNYSGQFQVAFDSSKLVRGINPASVQINLQAAGPGQPITSCALSSSDSVLKGTTCGIHFSMDSHGCVCPGGDRGEWVVLCDGHDPCVNCPSGYTTATISAINDTHVYAGCSYTCVKM